MKRSFDRSASRSLVVLQVDPLTVIQFADMPIGVFCGLLQRYGCHQSIQKAMVDYERFNCQEYNSKQTLGLIVTLR